MYIYIYPIPNLLLEIIISEGLRRLIVLKLKLNCCTKILIPILTLILMLILILILTLILILILINNYFRGAKEADCIYFTAKINLNPDANDNDNVNPNPNPNPNTNLNMQC